MAFLVLAAPRTGGPIRGVYMARAESYRVAADEVANLAIYTCSQQASATTGAALRVDGGVVDSIV